MKLGNALTVVVPLALLGGCAANPYPNTAPSAVAAAGRVTDNEFLRDRAYSAPVVQGSAQTGVNYSAQLVGLQSKADKSLINALNVTFTYWNNRWLFLNSAVLPAGRSLQTGVLDRHVEFCAGTGSCRYTEVLTAILPPDVMAAGLVKGLRISFNGTVVELPTPYVQGYRQGLVAAFGESPASKESAAEPTAGSSVVTESKPSSRSFEQALADLQAEHLDYPAFSQRYKALRHQYGME